MRDRNVLLLTLAYFCLMTANYGFTMWLPKIIHAISGASNLRVTLITAAVFLAEPPVLLMLAWHSDKTGERRWHTAIPVVIGATAFAFSQNTGVPVWFILVLLCISGAGIHAYRGGFWALPATFLTGTAAAASMGLINSFGNLGGFAGPYAVGYLSTRTGNYRSGVYYLVASAVTGALLTLAVRRRIPSQPPVNATRLRYTIFQQMHTRRLASFILGAWILGSLIMLFVSYQNGLNVDKILNNPPGPVAKDIEELGSDITRLLLKYQATEMNRFLSETWGVGQIGIGLAFLSRLRSPPTEASSS